MKCCPQKSPNELTLMKTRGLETGWSREERRGCCTTCSSCPDLPRQLDSDLQHHHFSSLGLLNLQAAPRSDLPNLCYPNSSPFEQPDKGPTCAVASHYAPKEEYKEAYKANCTCYRRQLLNSAQRGWNAPFHLAEQRPANLQGFKSES